MRKSSGWFVFFMGFSLAVQVGFVFATRAAFSPPAVLTMDPAVHLALDVNGDGVHDCSATVVSSRAILTATHCLFPLQGEPFQMFGETPTRIDDGRDSTLLVFETHRFERWAEVRSSSPWVSEKVAVMGNPGAHRMVYREGYVAAIMEEGVVLYDVNAFPGDSGAAVLDSQGRVVAVQSFVDVQSSRGVYLKLTGSFGFGFSEKEWRSAGVRRKK